jgi:hypothetical protein
MRVVLYMRVDTRHERCRSGRAFMDGYAKDPLFSVSCQSRDKVFSKLAELSDQCRNDNFAKKVESRSTHVWEGADAPRSGLCSRSGLR